ncbi:hypothetical protein DH2020_042208 [Rehmannia glutinosa]|uniref:Uncharacterized protein n=1 Tax=Rehmannia glutinosa TaxID=99300 RepID=A0ABR0UPE3_REHGL
MSVRGLTRISRSGYARRRWVYSLLGSNNSLPLLEQPTHFRSPVQSSQEDAFKDWELKYLSRQELNLLLSEDYVVLGCRVIYSWVSSALSSVGQQAHSQSSTAVEEQLDPFSLVADELSLVADRLRSMVVAEVPKLASAAEYFFKLGVEGKRFRPTVRSSCPSEFHAFLNGCNVGYYNMEDHVLEKVLLLMATALNVSVPRQLPVAAVDTLSVELRSRQQCIAEITEMIHASFIKWACSSRVGQDNNETGVCNSLFTCMDLYNHCFSAKLMKLDGGLAMVASLLHDDVLDDADTRRGIGSLNFVMGNKLAVLAGDFLLSRACVALASLKNTEVVSLLAKVVEHLVTGETMQMTTTSDQRCSMEYYMQKTYYKTASLISNSCKAIALLAGQTAEVSILAYEHHIFCTFDEPISGLAFQLIDDVLDFTGTSTSLGKGSLSDIRHVLSLTFSLYSVVLSGIVTAPILFAMEEFPELRDVVDQGFDNSANVDRALEYLGKSRGIQRTRELAAKHASLASAAIDSFPENDDEDVQSNVDFVLELGCYIYIGSRPDPNGIGLPALLIFERKIRLK